MARDAENRLVRVEPTPGQYSPPPDGARTVEFGYDYLGRRVQKQVWTRQSGEWVLTDVRKFVWSGWLMLLELQGGTGFQPVRKYTWGLDLAGLNGAVGQGSALPSQNAGLPPRRAGSGPASLEGAGGIGGLLAVQAPGAGPGGGNLDAVYTYDANGNVGQLVAWATGFGGAQGDEWHVDRLVAHYEYDPYGGVTAQAGTYAALNPVRYSTKYWDDETGLGYWGYRYYSPSLGRWISRDPIGELGGANMYAYGGNNPMSSVDHLGQKACPKWPGQQPPWSQPQSPASPRAREPFEWDPAEDPKEPNPKPPNCLLECPEACASPEAQAEIASNPDSEAAVICTPHCKCACLDQSNPALSNPRTNYERAERDCKLAHEEYHISDGVTCMWCLKPPCVARHTPFTSECRAYKTQYDCLVQKMRAADCRHDARCLGMVLVVIDATKIAAKEEGCDVSRW